MDQLLFEKIYSLARHSICLDSLVIFLANSLVIILPASLLLFIILSKNRRREIIMLIAAAAACILSRGIIVSLIRLAWHRPRPFIVLNLTPLINYGDKASFPSGHASFLFALALAVWFFHKRWGWFYLGLAVLGSLARIYIGIHWPSDILFGTIIGLLSACLVYQLFKKYQKKYQHKFKSLKKEMIRCDFII